MAVSSYHNSLMCLDMRDASSLDWNPDNFIISYLTGQPSQFQRQWSDCNAYVSFLFFLHIRLTATKGYAFREWQG